MPRKKDPKKALLLSIISPGIGLGSLYAGDIISGSICTLFGVAGAFKAYEYYPNYKKALDSGDTFSSVVLGFYFYFCVSGIVLSWIGDAYISYSFAKSWNNAIENKDLTEIKNSYTRNAIITLSFGLGIFTYSLVEEETSYDFNTRLTNGLVFMGTIIAPITIGYLLQAKQLDKAVFEEDIKQTLSSPIIVSPMISPDYSGIMIAKRF